MADYGADPALVASQSSQSSLSRPSGFDPGEWQPIETAPLDGTAIQARIPGHGSDNVIACHDGFLDSDGQDCASWVFVTEKEPPDCWTDGVCWEINEDGNASVKPTHWKPLAASCDTHPKDGDVKQAPLVSGAVPEGQTHKTQSEAT
jgi:hypothetical protein